jgi:hypothetical protein
LRLDAGSKGCETDSLIDIYFTDCFNVPREALDSFGAFDVSLVNDLPLFVDPFLLFNSDDATYQGLHDEIIRYMRFLKEVASKGTLAPRLLDAWFTFPEGQAELVRLQSRR